MDQQLRIKRKKRIRKKINGSLDQPRLTVYRSTKHIYTQLINDSEQQTIISASSTEKDVKSQPAFDNKIIQAKYIGRLIGKRALDKGIKQVVFDRNGYRYHGRVRAIAEGAREAGLVF